MCKIKPINQTNTSLFPIFYKNLTKKESLSHNKSRKFSKTQKLWKRKGSQNNWKKKQKFRSKRRIYEKFPMKRNNGLTFSQMEKIWQMRNQEMSHPMTAKMGESTRTKGSEAEGLTLSLHLKIKNIEGLKRIGSQQKNLDWEKSFICKIWKRKIIF